MSLKASNKSGRVDVLEAGSYPGWVIQVVDLGIQEQQPYKGQEKEPCQEILLTYEFADEFLKDEEGNDIDSKPRYLSETFRVYSLDADKAKSTQRYLALDPNREFGGDFAALAGVPCNITVLVNEKGDKLYNNVGLISTMREKDKRKVGLPFNKPVVFDLDEPDASVFSKFPSWIQERIKKNINFEGSALAVALENYEPDEEEEKEAAPSPRPSAVKAPKKASVDDVEDDDIPF